MGKIDKVKEQIDYLKGALLLFIGTAFAIVGWLSQNYKTADAMVIFLSIIVSMIFSLVAVWINRKILSAIDELEDL
jgi:hypothetical protein